MAEEDRVLNKTKKFFKWGGIVSGGLVAMLTPLIVMYVEVKPQVDEATANAEGGYEAIVPAVMEIQSILNESKEWAEDTDAELRSVISGQKEIEKRLARCEAYIDLLGDRRGLPSAPDPIEDDFPVSIETDPRRPNGSPVQQKAQYEIPKSIGGAKAKVDARKKAGCAPGDPLCGVLD